MPAPRFPELSVETCKYTVDSLVAQSAKVEVSPLEHEAMSVALEIATIALKSGNPPVGAVLIDHTKSRQWSGETSDISEQHLMKHAEIVIYEMAQPYVKDDLSDCTLVTTAVPCTSCTPHYAEGKIGKIIYGAPRNYVYELSGIMRPRNVNMDTLLGDGNTNTEVVGNYRADESLALFAAFGIMKRHPTPPKRESYLRGLLSRKPAQPVLAS